MIEYVDFYELMSDYFEHLDEKTLQKNQTKINELVYDYYYIYKQATLVDEFGEVISAPSIRIFGKLFELSILKLVK